MKKTISFRVGLFLAVLAILSVCSVTKVYADISDPNGGRTHNYPENPTLDAPPTVTPTPKKPAKKPRHKATKKSTPPASQPTVTK